MSITAFQSSKKDTVYVAESGNQKGYLIDKFGEFIQEEAALRKENINLIRNSEFIRSIPWNLSENSKKVSKILTDVEGFKKIGSSQVLCIYTGVEDKIYSVIQYDHEIILPENEKCVFNVYVACHRSSGAVHIELCDSKGVSVRNIYKKFPANIEGGEKIENYLLINVEFVPIGKEKKARIYIEKSPTLEENDSYLFFTRPWMSHGPDTPRGWIPCPNLFTEILLESIAQNNEPTIYLMREDVRPILEDANDKIDLLFKEPFNLDIGKFIVRSDSINKNVDNILKITIGTILYNNTIEEIDNLGKFSKISVDFCKDKIINKKIEFDFIYIDNSPSRIDISSEFFNWREIENIMNLGFAKGHNKLMKFAFDINKSDMYIMINPDGYPLESCFKEMIEVSFHEKIGLVEAIQFPIEHPKPYDIISLDTPWCSGACLLITKAAYKATNGFDENFAMYCEDVDLSWTVKSEGFSIKSAPKALFFHDVRDRSSENTRKNMYLSGRYLGYKWNDADFVKWTEDLLIDIKFVTEKQFLPPLPKLKKVFIEDYTEFRYGFYFAIPRWQ